MANNLNYPTYTNPYNNLQKINGDFQFTEQIKDYAMNPIWKGQYSSLWNTVSGAAEEIGQVVYEHIANYVQNIDDIDTCGLDRLYSIAKELDVEHVFSYNLQYPPELGDIMDLLSIGKSYLLTSGCCFWRTRQYLSWSHTNLSPYRYYSLCWLHTWAHRNAIPPWRYCISANPI